MLVAPMMRAETRQPFASTTKDRHASWPTNGKKGASRTSMTISSRLRAQACTSRRDLAAWRSAEQVGS
jgi:hypothetical protein